MSGKELDYIHDAFASNWIAPVGPHVDAFEKEFCALTGAPHAAAVSSGTAALHLALILANVQQGDDVACSTFTFAGSAFPVVYCGARPVFIDSEPQSWNMDPGLLAQAIEAGKKNGNPVKAVVVVHLYGQSANLDEILDICEQNNITLIEDAAESLGASYKGTATGTLGKIGIFSFNGNKIVTTSGGGMLVSADKDLVDKARFLATQARDPAPHYEHSNVGYNYRMSNILAGIGRAQLGVLLDRVATKRRIFDVYKEQLACIDGFEFMPEPAWGVSNRWLTCCTVDVSRTGVSANDIRLRLEEENIESRPLWKPMHLQPVFSKASAYVNGVSEKLFANGLCLPSGTSMTDADLERVIECVKTVEK
jgi:pyridoxal phosphate-dependent aminotransferase EpsN